MNQKSELPPCPRCRSAKLVYQDGETYWCRKCGGRFDDKPDEGGTHSDFNPAARLERADRERERKVRR